MAACPRTLAVLCLLAAARGTGAAEAAAVPPEPGPWRLLDLSHAFLSEGLETVVRRVDAFFANTPAYEGGTGSYAQLTGDLILREGGERDALGNVRLRLRLPRTRERLHLLLETDPDRTPAAGPGGPLSPAATSSEPLPDEDYFGSLEGLVGELRRWRVRPSLGVKFADPVDPFVRLRLQRRGPADTWQSWFQQDIYRFKEAGTVLATTLELDRRLGRQHLLRSVSSGQWREDTGVLSLSQALVLYRPLSAHRALAWEVAVYGNDEPVLRATAYATSLRYRQRLHRDYLYGELVPAVRWRRENDWEAEASLTLRIELLVGEAYRDGGRKAEDEGQRGR